MKLILFLIALLFLGCVLYGIYCVVTAIVRSAARLNSTPPSAQRSTPLHIDQPAPVAESSASSTASATITALQTLHASRQNGGLTDVEFQDLKQHLLTETSQ